MYVYIYTYVHTSPCACKVAAEILKNQLHSPKRIYDIHESCLVSMTYMSHVSYL